MASTKHTPGPWETVAGSTPNDLAVCEAGGGDIIAEVVNGKIGDRDLIAKAWLIPELLEACERLCDEIDRIINKQPANHYSALEIGRAAIAKATTR